MFMRQPGIRQYVPSRAASSLTFGLDATMTGLFRDAGYSQFGSPDSRHRVQVGLPRSHFILRDRHGRHEKRSAPSFSLAASAIALSSCAVATSW